MPAYANNFEVKTVHEALMPSYATICQLFMGYKMYANIIPTMKGDSDTNDNNGAPENTVSADAATPVQEAVENAKEAFKGAANAGAVAAATIGAELAAKVEEKLKKLGIDPAILSEGAEGSGVEGSFDFSKVKVEPLFEEQVDFDTFSKSDFQAVKVKDCVVVPKSKKLLQFTLDDGTGVDRCILSGIHAYYEPKELIGKTCIAITNLPPRKMMGIDSCGMLISAVHEEGGEENSIF